MAIEKCGEVAKNRIEYTDGKVIWLCDKHFANDDIQYMLVRKWIRRQYVDGSEERCVAEVRRREREESVGGKDAQEH